MRKVNINEIQCLEKILNKGEIDNGSVAIDIMIKYLVGKGYYKEDIEEEIYNFIAEHEETFTDYDWWQQLSNRKITKVFKLLEGGIYNPNFFKLEELPIYKEELEIINILESEELRSVAFIMLVYSKIANTIREFKVGRQLDENGDVKPREYWITNLDTDYINAIFTEALSKKIAFEPRMKVLVEIIKHDLVEVRCGKNNNLKLLYAKEEGEIAFTINNFEDGMVVYNYLLYCNPEAYIQCPKCGKYFKKRQKTQKYCTNCGSTKKMTDKQFEAREKEKAKEKAKPSLLKRRR